MFTMFNRFMFTFRRFSLTLSSHTWVITITIGHSFYSSLHNFYSSLHNLHTSLTKEQQHMRCTQQITGLSFLLMTETLM